MYSGLLHVRLTDLLAEALLAEATPVKPVGCVHFAVQDTEKERYRKMVLIIHRLLGPSSYNPIVVSPVVIIPRFYTPLVIILYRYKIIFQLHCYMLLWLLSHGNKPPLIRTLKTALVIIP